MKDALAAGGVYTLNGDVNISAAAITVPAGVSSTLDLNGYTVTAANTVQGRILVQGELTLRDGKGGGKIVSSLDYSNSASGYGLVYIEGENTSATMESGTIYAVRENAVKKGQFGVVVMDGGDFTMTGGRIEAGWYAVAGNGLDVTTNSTVEIKGGELISVADYAMYLPHSGTTTISGGKVNGAAGGVSLNRGTLNITADADVRSTDEGDTGQWGDGTGKQGNAAVIVEARYGDSFVNIDGGTLTAETQTVMVPASGFKKTITVSGGKFSDFAAMPYLAIGASVDVTLAGDIDLKTPVEINAEKAEVNVDLNGHDIVNRTEIPDGKYGNTIGFKVKNGTLDIGGNGHVHCLSGGDDVADGYRMAVWACGNGVVNIHGGNFYNEQKTDTQIDLIYANDNGTVNIYGGEFESWGHNARGHWVLNLKDSDRKTAHINVYGGTFINFNPANCLVEVPYWNFVADGYKAMCEGKIATEVHDHNGEAKEYTVVKAGAK